MCRSQDNLVQLVFSFNLYKDPGVQTQVLSAVWQVLYLPNHLATYLYIFQMSYSVNLSEGKPTMK